MNAFEYVLIFCGGWVSCEIFRFIRKEVKAARKSCRRKDDTSPPGRPTYAEIEEILRNRLKSDGSKIDSVNFSLWQAPKRTKSEDLFDYIINGMNYPVISHVEERRRADSSERAAFTIDINGRDIWFHTIDDQQRLSEMVSLFESYIKAGCPKMEGLSPENIVNQARERVTGGQQFDPVRVFGFKFAEEV